MFKHIAVPVDLTHIDRLDHVLDVAAAQAKLYDAPVTYISVSSSLPGAAGRTPAQFNARLEEFARTQGETRGISTDSLPILSGDPVIDVDYVVVSAVKEIGADLIIMATHRPGLAEYFWPSNGAAISAHSEASVFLVRDS